MNFREIIKQNLPSMYNILINKEQRLWGLEGIEAEQTYQELRTGWKNVLTLANKNGWLSKTTEELVWLNTICDIANFSLLTNLFSEKDLEDLGAYTPLQKFKSYWTKYNIPDKEGRHE